MYIRKSHIYERTRDREVKWGIHDILSQGSGAAPGASQGRKVIHRMVRRADVQ